MILMVVRGRRWRCRGNGFPAPWVDELVFVLQVAFAPVQRLLQFGQRSLVGLRLSPVGGAEYLQRVCQAQRSALWIM